MEENKKEKRYFVDMMFNDRTSFSNLTIVEKLICILFVIVICLGIFIAVYIYNSNKNYEAYNSYYPEEVYEYLENVADEVVKDGAFYQSIIPKDVKFNFTDEGDLVLTYNSVDIEFIFRPKVTIKFSEKYEIQSKERNILSNYEWQEKMKIDRIGVSVLGSALIIGFIVVIVDILLVWASVISKYNKQKNIENSNIE